MKPCEQEDNIIHISRTLERMEKSQDKVVELLEKVSNQEPRILHLEEHSERFYEQIEKMSERLHDIELDFASSPSARTEMNNVVNNINKKLERLFSYVTTLTSKPAQAVYVTILVMLLTGTILDVTYHFETLKAIILFFKP